MKFNLHNISNFAFIFQDPWQHMSGRPVPFIKIPILSPREGKYKAKVKRDDFISTYSKCHMGGPKPAELGKEILYTEFNPTMSRNLQTHLHITLFKEAESRYHK